MSKQTTKHHKLTVELIVYF